MYHLPILLLLGKERESGTERGLAHKVVMSLVLSRLHRQFLFLTVPVL